MMQKNGKHEVAVVREVPRQGQGAWEAYTVSKEGENPDKKNWKPLRIKVFTEDLKDPSKYCSKVGDYRPTFQGVEVQCKQSDILSTKKNSTLVNRILPAAVKLHAERLLVEQEKTPLVFQEFYLSSLCRQFTVPKEHHTSGIPDADMALYVAAGPSQTWAVTCAIKPHVFRPVAGAMNFAPQAIHDLRRTVRVAAHEIAHALGFNYHQLDAHHMIVNVADSYAKRVMVVRTPNTRSIARKHFQCKNISGMPLETLDAPLSHWDPRVAKDELMSGDITAGYYTALTMAVFEDLGFYRAVWSMAEPMNWGNNSGCELFIDNCSSSRHPSMFCSKEDLHKPNKSLRCTSDRTAVGRCSDLMHGVGLGDAEECPALMPFNDLTPSGVFYPSVCADKQTEKTPGSLMGRGSWCLDAESVTAADNVTGEQLGSIEGVCVRVLCTRNAVKVKYLGSKKWEPCQEGQNITANSSLLTGIIKCPKYEEVCTIAPSGRSLVSSALETIFKNGQRMPNDNDALLYPEEDEEKPTTLLRPPR